MKNFPLNTICLESIDSTNNYLKRKIKEEKNDFHATAVMTNHQDAGRGRLGRKWISVDGNTLCMSIAVKNKRSDGFTLLVALAVLEALKPFCKDKSLQIKWPNDIICENKKLSGILCERIGEYTVIGIGVNVNDQSFASEISHKATSLFILNHTKLALTDVFASIVSAFESVMTRYNFTFTKEAKQAYENLCANFGRSVSTGTSEGKAVGIDDDGSLLIDTKDGTVAVSSGEVIVHNIY